jgi:PKD repeat protein
VVNGETPPPEPAENEPPVASFASSCAGLGCTFTETGSDPDGTLTAWSWSFGDGATSSERNPGHSYGAPGTYAVRLTVTDDSSATATVERSVTVTAIALQARGRKRNGFAYVDLTWSGASGKSVRVFRNGNRIATVTNDGAWTDATGRKGTPTFSYRICEVGTTACSNTVTVRF